uniref:Mitochondrial inner membrane protease ATP23 n=1 Tax=Rhabditophanes sp. KR3021 TaxID=114890 RepID=A0AC35TZQ0_9BILA
MTKCGTRTVSKDVCEHVIDSINAKYDSFESCKRGKSAHVESKVCTVLLKNLTRRGSTPLVGRNESSSSDSSASSKVTVSSANTEGTPKLNDEQGTF